MEDVEEKIVVGELIGDFGKQSKSPISHFFVLGEQSGLDDVQQELDIVVLVAA